MKNKNLDFQLGEKVIWKNAGTELSGYFFKDLDSGFCIIISTKSQEEIKVKKSILKLDI